MAPAVGPRTLVIPSLDHEGATEARRILLECLDLLAQKESVVMDLEGIAGLDLAGLQVLLAFRKSLLALAARGGEPLRLTWHADAARERVKRLCSFAGVDAPDLFDIPPGRS